jgi:SNF2 family DNA or RNA helicase
MESAQAIRESAKLDRLIDMVSTLLSDGRKILIFSQFTSMLDLIELRLKDLSISWVRISGDTKDRGKPVEDFQAGKVPVFLISLKAGGTGLNLTAADTVIHYDPWWNPAAEQQATDRAYRIGQDKPVMVYKLVAEGTVEEKILELQQQKKQLSDAIIDNEGGLAKALTQEDLKWLFSGPPKS